VYLVTAVLPTPRDGELVIPLSRCFTRGQGLSTYTHVSDQHSTFDTKVIAATAPESPYMLDGILGNQTDLLITEHATDAHGATLANFALFDLVDLQLSPRIRDLGKITLYHGRPRGRQAMLIQAAAERPRGRDQGVRALRRTIYAARYLADETYRRRIGRQLNKG
jgi:TnpA family transposase